MRNIKIIATSDKCELMATDQEVGIRLHVDGTRTEQPGEILLPADRTLAILGECPDEMLAIDGMEQNCVIRGERTEFELCGEDPAKLPDVQEFSGDHYHEIDAGSLRELIRRTIFAAAAENARYALEGTLWEAEDQNIRLVATDGRRLATSEGKANQHNQHRVNGSPHVVPTKAMHLLEKALLRTVDEVKVSLKPNYALFKTGSTTIHTRLLEGRYPAYREVFPKEPTAVVSLPIGPLHSAVRQAAIMTDPDSHKITLEFAIGKLTLTAQGADAGRSNIELPISFEGKAATIAFDFKLLIDMLRVLPPEEDVTLQLAGAEKPAVFRLGADYSYVVMPLA